MANGILDYAQLGAPVFNFAKGLAIGPSEAYVSDTMRNQLIQKAKETELDKGTLGYEAFGLPVATEGGRFTGGLFELALKIQLLLEMSVVLEEFLLKKIPLNQEDINLEILNMILLLIKTQEALVMPY